MGQMACTALPLLLTAHLLPRRQPLPRWLPTSSVMVLSAQEDAALMLDGTAAHGMYCAATAADCPFVAKKTALAKMAANKQCDGTECPGGCCPYVGWYCCPDGMYCAATAADCPFVAKKTALAKMTANKQCDGTECPGGCCPNVGWYCCPDGMYCAAT